jgi:phosphatidylinositol alpha-1,6-mannosyltransferase
MDRFFRPITRNSLSDADLVLTISDYTQSYIESLRVSPSKIIKIRPATDPKQFRPGLKGCDLASSIGISGRIILLTVGKFTYDTRYKGQDMVIRALAKVKRVIPQIIYVIAGVGSDEQYLKKIANECGVTNNVKFLSKVSDDDLPLLYKCCDAFIMVSREEKGFRYTNAEGFGIVFLEASATGKPVIGGRSGGIPDAVKDGVTGILVDPTNMDAIASAVIRVLTEPRLAEKLGNNGRRWIEEEMNWDRAAKEFNDTYFRFFQCA